MADPGAWAPAEGERRALAEAGLAVWSGRLILDAQPPVDDPTLAEVAGRCNGSLPEPLVSLWRASFGGRLDYDLEGVSFTELFYPGSDDYDDLWGWIDHERGLIDGRKLDHLPFGGFEYLDRLYVRTRAGAGHGAVVFWQQGLPPGWELTDGDRAGAFADDLPALFGRLALESDPWVDDDGDSGADMRDAVDELAGAEPELAARLRSMVRAAVLDWRGALADGSVAGRERLRRLAFDRASAAGDVEVLGCRGCGCWPRRRGTREMRTGPRCWARWPIGWIRADGGGTAVVC